MQKCTGLYKGHGAFFVWGEKRFYPYIAAFLSPLLADAEYDAIQKSLGDAVDVVEMSCIFAVYGVFLLLLSHDYAQMF